MYKEVSIGAIRALRISSSQPRPNHTHDTLPHTWVDRGDLSSAVPLDSGLHITVTKRGRDISLGDNANVKELKSSRSSEV